MDEADELGDRIAIMSNGRLVCSGSPSFLKTAMGVGYQLTLSRSAAGVAVRPPRTVGAQEDLLDRVTKHVPGAIMTSVAAGEVRMRLPLGATASFPALFQDLDALIDSAGLDSYALSVTNIEDVFLATATRTATASGTASDASTALAAVQTEANLGPSAANVLTMKRIVVHAQAILLVRWRQIWRLWTTSLCAVLAPAAVAAVAVLVIALSAQAVRPGGNVIDVTGAYRVPFQRAVVAGWSLNNDTAQYESIAGFVNGLAAQAVNLTTFENTPDPSGFVAAVPDNTSIAMPLARMSAALLLGPNSGAGAGVLWLAPAPLSSVDPVSPPTSSAVGMLALLNSSLVYGAPAIMNALTSSLACTGGHGPDGNCTGVSLRYAVFSEAAESATAQSASAAVAAAQSVDRGINTALISSFGLAIVPSVIAATVAKEYMSGLVAHLQLAGMAPVSYLLSTTAVHSAVSLASSMAQLAVLASAVVPGVTDSQEAVSATASMLAMHAVSSTALAVMVALLTRSPATAQSCIVLISIASVAIAAALFNLAISPESCRQGTAMSQGLRIVPSFATTLGLMTLAGRQTLLAAAAGLPADCRARLDVQSPGAVAAGPVSWMAACGCAFLAAAMMLEGSRYFGVGNVMRLCGILRAQGSKVTSCRSNDMDDDGDVAAEARRVSEAMAHASDEALLVHRLRKEYAASTVGSWSSGWCCRRPRGASSGHSVRVAVRSLSLGVPQGSVYGFLGTNGAGKTTTLRMVVGDETPTAGEVRVAGRDVHRSRAAVLASGQVGYCAQFDAIPDGLTVMEVLDLVLRLRRPACPATQAIVDACINAFQLREWCGRVASTLSGGNKRKLSVALAFIGSPQVAVLDEPSTGMDAVAKRRLWSTINALSTPQPDPPGHIGAPATAPAVIVTSHAMEEVEALCTRVGIMVGGQLRCLGTVQHLKDRHAGMLVVHLEIATTAAEPTDRIAAHVAECIPGGTLVDALLRVGGMRCLVQCPVKPSLSDCFAALTELQASQPALGITDFSVSQVTLEHVFLAAAELKTPSITVAVAPAPLRTADSPVPNEAADGAMHYSNPVHAAGTGMHPLEP